MRARAPFVAAVALTLFASGPAAAYTISAEGTGSEPVFTRWFIDSINYQINNQTSASLPNVAAGSDPLTAVARGFQAWNDVPTSRVQGNFQQLTSKSTNARDNVNLITFVDNTFAYNAGTLAVTLIWRFTSNGQIVEADMLFNPAVQWSTRDPGSNVFDVQQIAAHEGGHFFGLGHSAMNAATMFPYAADQVQLERVLDPDDIAAISELYPAESFATTCGTIEGQVTKNGAAVFGAQVVAVNDQGRPVASAVSEKDGSYRISGLPEDSYQIYAEPIDGPMTQQNLGGYWTSTTFDTAFRTTLEASFINVLPGVTSSGQNIAVPAFSPTLNPRYIGLQPVTGGSFSADGILRTVLQGDVNTWNVVIGGDGLTSPGVFSIAGPGVTRVGGFSYGFFGGGIPYIKARFDFAAGAEASPRVILVSRSSEIATFSGALEVLPNPARLTIVEDTLLAHGLYLTWYGGTPPFVLQRDTERDFSAPETLYSATDINFRDAVLDDGIDYYYRVAE